MNISENFILNELGTMNSFNPPNMTNSTILSLIIKKNYIFDSIK
jgi:hypothetical protein